MFNTIWNIVTWPFKMLKKGWDAFETWAASVAPGLKTKTTSFLGMVGSSAAIAQQYFSQAPLSQFISAEKIVLVGLVLFTLTFWFRRLADKVEPDATPMPMPTEQPPVVGASQ